MMGWACSSYEGETFIQNPGEITSWKVEIERQRKRIEDNSERDLKAITEYKSDLIR
jgi:hypothetical protein